MKTTLRHGAFLVLQGVYYSQLYTSPTERELSEDGNDPDYDTTPIKDKHTIVQPLVIRQLRNITSTARIVAPKPKRRMKLPNRAERRALKQMEEIVREMNLA